jgi:hypothetical protein
MQEKKAKAYLQSEAQLVQHLRDHIGFLQTSADAYDGGVEGEAKRLAVSIRVLVHDTHVSKSLLGQLGEKNIQFFDSSFPMIPGILNTHCGLAATLLDKGAKYVACLDDTPAEQTISVDFESWWNSPVVLDAKGNRLSRKDLVLAVADQDGGAHVDPSLSQIYADLSRNNSVGGWVSSGKSIQPMGGPERAAIRQIAHELLKTLLAGYSKFPAYPRGSVVLGTFPIMEVADDGDRDGDK